MQRQILNIFVLLCFVLSNSNLFIYQHFCGGDLYATTFFSTASCECGDEPQIVFDVSGVNFVNLKDSGCCSEKLIFAHIDDAFVNYHFVIKMVYLFFAFLVFGCYLFRAIRVFFQFVFSKLFRRRISFFALYFQYQIVRCVVLRN